MKTYITLSLVAVVFALAYGCSTDEEPSPVSDNHHFRQTFWGMPSEKVKEAEDAPLADEKPPHVITYHGKFEGLPVIIGYLFEDNKLVRAGYVMTQSYSEPELYVQDFNKLRDFYVGTYGSPAYDRINWGEGAPSDIKADEYAQAACDGNAQYQAGWVTQASMVRLTLHGRDGKCELGVMYASKQYYVNPELKQEQ